MRRFFTCLTLPFPVKIPPSASALLYPKVFHLHFDSNKPPMFTPVLLKLQFGGLIPLTFGEQTQLL